MVFKSAKSPVEALNASIAKMDPAAMKAVGEVLDKHLTNDPEGNPLRTAVQAISRIASSIKGKVPKTVIQEALDAVGLDSPSGAFSVGETPDGVTKGGPGSGRYPAGSGGKKSKSVQEAHTSEGHFKVGEPGPHQGPVVHIEDHGGGYHTTVSDNKDGTFSSYNTSPTGGVKGGYEFKSIREAVSAGREMAHADRHEKVKKSDEDEEEIEMGMMGQPEAMEKARECAEKAYDEEMKKLGHPKYPDAQVTMKSKSGEPAKPKEDGVEKAATASLDAATQAKLDAVFKSHDELVKKAAQVDELITKNTELRTQVVALELVNKQRDFVQKAAKYDSLGLPREMIVKALVDADKAGKECLESIEKQYDMLLERQRVSKAFGGDMFREIGTSTGGSSSGSETTWSKIEKAAEGFVQKSAFQGTKEESIAKFLGTAEGQAMYAEYKAGRKDGI